MKKTPALIAFAVGLTLVLYMATTYLLPGPPPSAALVGLLAAVALAVVFGVNALWGKKGGAQASSTGKKPGNKAGAILLLALMGGMGLLQGCKSSPRAGSPPSVGSASPGGAPGSPPPVGSASPGGAATSRVTGIALLLAGENEEAGFGLYSYALLSHPPGAAELTQYKAFLKALLALPTAASMEKYVPKQRINLTLIPVKQGDTPDDQDGAVDYVLEHYDYARSTVLLAALATKVGHGPVLISVLQPINPAAHPYPVLVQDLTRAQPTLMATYVSGFVDQVAQERFWEESAMGKFALSLRNSLETAAVGLGMSKTAVDSWVKFFGKAPAEGHAPGKTHQG